MLEQTWEIMVVHNEIFLVSPQFKNMTLYSLKYKRRKAAANKSNNNTKYALKRVTASR